MDDPLMWGILPLPSFFSNRNSRWTIGARDILFTNPRVDLFFQPIYLLTLVLGYTPGSLLMEKSLIQKEVEVYIKKL